MQKVDLLDKGGNDTARLIGSAYLHFSGITFSIGRGYSLSSALAGIPLLQHRENSIIETPTAANTDLSVVSVNLQHRRSREVVTTLVPFPQ